MYLLRVGPRPFLCSPQGRASVRLDPGEYRVPDDVDEVLAQRCLRSGLGRIVEAFGAPPSELTAERSAPKRRGKK